ncbi:MAG TPA: cytochrome c biogenesis protein CcdA [Gemmatimonas sp.]|uniref:cytochrome c biogenesis protein CcdA n=1 Tax=Gemmatimonas sp. TaxID=1962908 RepID=UPI002EDAA308
MALPDVGNLLSTQSWLTYPAVFAGGVLTSLTPCIYPMIPITAAVVGGQQVGTRGTLQGSTRCVAKQRAWTLTLAYVFGLALSYAALGLLAGMTGALFGAVSTNRWLLLAMANLLVVFALMMFDVIAVPVPTSWLQRAASLETRGRVVSAFGMGAASGLVAAPCGAPVMATLLTWVAATHSAWRGFTYLFVFSLGMSSLLVVVGLAAGGAMQLPRAGTWMVRVKTGFGVLMLGMAEYYLLQAGQVWF